MFTIQIFIRKEKENMLRMKCAQVWYVLPLIFGLKLCLEGIAWDGKWGKGSWRWSISPFKIISNSREAPPDRTKVLCSTWGLGTHCSGSASPGAHALKDSIRMCLRLSQSIPPLIYFSLWLSICVIWLSGKAVLNNKVMSSECYVSEIEA